MLETILIILLILILLGGVGPWFPAGYGYGQPVNLVVLVLLIILIVYLVGGHGRLL